jgi:hypothetical protein
MPIRHSKVTIISMAVIASGIATLLHEGVGHGVVAWLRGDIPAELTSNHLSTLRPDRWVDAGGTLVNLVAGAASLLISRRAADHANLRYFFWILAALNLLLVFGNRWVRRLERGDPRSAPSSRIAHRYDCVRRGAICDGRTPTRRFCPALCAE